MCPSCESKPINPMHGVCNDCAKMYLQSLGPDWKNTEVGQFLLGSNLETMRMAERIAHEPTGYAIEAVAETVQEDNVITSKDVSVDEMIEALVNVHGWGYGRIHAFLSKGGYSPPSLRTIARRVDAIRKKQAA